MRIVAYKTTEQNGKVLLEVSTGATLEVGEFLYRHGIGPGDNEGYRSLLHIGVDGVMLSRPIEEGQ